MDDHTRFDFHFDVWRAGHKHRAANARQIAVTLDVEGTEYTDKDVARARSKAISAWKRVFDWEEWVLGTRAWMGRPGDTNTGTCAAYNMIVLHDVSNVKVLTRKISVERSKAPEERTCVCGEFRGFVVADRDLIGVPRKTADCEWIRPKDSEEKTP